MFSKFNVKSFRLIFFFKSLISEFFGGGQVYSTPVQISFGVDCTLGTKHSSVLVPAAYTTKHKTRKQGYKEVHLPVTKKNVHRNLS